MTSQDAAERDPQPRAERATGAGRPAPRRATGVIYGRPRASPETVPLRTGWQEFTEAAPRPDRVPVTRRPAAALGRTRRAGRRDLIRLAETGVWTAAIAVVAAMIAFVVNTQSVSAGPEARFLPPARATLGVPCIFEPCPRSERAGTPTAVRIPTIDVTSPLEVLGLDASGELVAPSEYHLVGWYGDGVVPGDVGPAVLAGHIDSLTGPAVFYDLATLTAGDRIEVERGGEWIVFLVTGVERYPKDEFPTERVYRPTPTPELRLITCGGTFDRARGVYRDNIVVYAVAA